MRRIYDGINLNQVTSGKNYSFISVARRLRGRRYRRESDNANSTVCPVAVYSLYRNRNRGTRSRIPLVGPRKSARSFAGRSDKRPGNVNHVGNIF